PKGGNECVDGGGVALAVDALVASLGQRHRSPFPAQRGNRPTKPVGNRLAEHGRLVRWPVGRVQIGPGRTLDDRVVVVFAGIARDHSKLAKVELELATWLRPS